MLRDKLVIPALVAVLISAAPGCSLLIPEKALKPVIRNPFPQLSRVAVAPFFNQSDEPTVDGRQVALAYFAELQTTPGFEVVPVGVVEEAIIANQVDLSGPGEARRLAQILGVDAVVIGSVTDFSPYYPPRMGLRVEWYTANPGYHEIPAGYGLPWCTPEEEFIPDSLVYESQMALAKAQMKGLAPDCEGQCQTLPPPPGSAATESGSRASDGPAVVLPPQAPAPADEPAPSGAKSAAPAEDGDTEGPLAPGAAYDPFDPKVELAVADEEMPAETAPMPAAEPLPSPPRAGKVSPRGATVAAIAGAAVGAAPHAANAQAPCPSGACAAGGAPCLPHNGPVLSHTRIYNGNDADVADALEGYVSFRADDRFGGWKSYLDRSDDYIRFCCRMHISEMLSARGGSRKMQVVWRWPESR